MRRRRIPGTRFSSAVPRAASPTDPVFHLAGGFADFTTRLQAGGREFTRRSGRTALVNPRRYGAMTSFDYARYRLSVFSREEAAAIVMYLEYRREGDATPLDVESIDAALELFWRERARSARTSADLAVHLVAEDEYISQLRARPGR